MSKILKAVTFSYDDGLVEDKPLIELFNKYNVKGTFNVSSGYLDRLWFGHKCLKEKEVKSVYTGHEVAVHTVTHHHLLELTDEQFISEVENDRLALENLVGYDIIGMAYPFRKYNQHLVELLRNHTKIQYSRTCERTLGFELPKEKLEFHPTVHSDFWDETFDCAERFMALKDVETPKLFYIWGHSIELESKNGWENMEKLLKMISGKDDIFYGTNRQIIEKFYK